MATVYFKCTEEAKTHVPEDMRLELEADARDAGCTFDEALRDLIYLAKKGVTYGEHVANHRRAILMRTGQHQGIKGPDE